MLSPALHQRGVSMIEVLVTVVILAIGLLGVAGLQVQALRSSKSSYERNVILEHSSRIMEAIRANPDIALSYAIDSTALPTNAPNCTTACSDAQRAQIDLVAVRDSLEESLDGFQPEFELDVAPVAAGVEPPFEVSLRIEWTTRNAAGGGTVTFEYETESVI